MGQFHFVEDYVRLVRALIASHPLDEAMSLAVGGDYDVVGSAEVDLLSKCGLKDGDFVIDIGCGSGRLAKHLGLRYRSMKYLGTDVVEELLDYAAKNSPSHYRFILHRQVSIPAESSSADFVTAFSVFTHLFHEESYAYLQDAVRVLKPGGAIIFSFFEFQQHWTVFETILDIKKRGLPVPHLNMFIERSGIEIWAKRLGLHVEGYFSIGQSAVLLRKSPLRRRANLFDTLFNTANIFKRSWGGLVSK